MGTWGKARIFRSARAAFALAAALSFAHFPSSLAQAPDACDLRSKLSEILDEPDDPRARWTITRNSGLDIRSVSELKPHEFENRNTVAIVAFAGGKKRFVFKPSAGESPELLHSLLGSAKPGAMAEREVLASRIDAKLGLGRVPEARLLTLQGRPGVAIDFVEGGSMEELFPTDELWNQALRESPVVSRAVEEQSIFDFLIGNHDRVHMDYSQRPPEIAINPGNWMFKAGPKGEVEDVRFIDQGASFSPHFRLPLKATPEQVMDYQRRNLRVLSDLLPRNVSVYGSQLLGRIAKVSDTEWRALFAPHIRSGHLTVEDLNGFLLRRKFLLIHYKSALH